MGLYKRDLPDGLDEFDVIIAGGGSAGCVVAGRVAAADPSLSVLLIESGQNNYMNPTVMNPAMYLSHLIPESTATIWYSTNKSKDLADREVIVPAGGILGGGSSTNFMMYTRAQRSDYDSWQTPGWSTDEVLPYLRKLETYHGPGDAKLHGTDGPIIISDGSYRSKKSEDDWLQAAEKVGYPEIRDLQDLRSNNGFQRWLRYVNPKGIRSDAAHAYVHPRLHDGKHPNFHVLCESKVVRVLFDDDKRACGVEYEPNVIFHPFDSDSQPHPKKIVRARKQVVISCGSCSTPSVLERSGLGDANILKTAGVPLVEDLPGVGADYQDHHLMLYGYKTHLEPMDTLDGLLQQRIPPEEMAGHPHLGWNSCDIASKIRPTEADVDELGPEFRKIWDRDFKDQTDRPVMLIAVLNGYFDLKPIPADGQYVTLALYTAYPYSRGHIHITGPNITDRVDFEVGFLSDANDIDLKKHIWAYKKSREIMRRTNYHAGEVDHLQPKFPEGSKVASVLEREKEENITQNLEYTAEDDRAIEQFIRENVGTTWHSLGTARMCPRDKMGVVDERCGVYGVKGLRIADLSIVPVNIGANTNNTALMIGEKVADFILEDLGLKK